MTVDIANVIIDPMNDAINVFSNAICLSLPTIIPISIPTNKKNGMIVDESLLNNEKIIIIRTAIIILFNFIVSFILMLSPQKNFKEDDKYYFSILVVGLLLHQSLQGSIHLQYIPVHTWRMIAVLLFYLT